MTGILFLFGAALFGIALVRRLGFLSLNYVEQVLWGLVIGWSAATAFGYGFARVTGGLSFRTALLVTLFVLGGAMVSWAPTVRDLFRLKHKSVGLVWDKALLPLVLLFAVFTPIYLRLFLTHMLPVHADGGIYSGGESTSYDMAYHAAITTSFAYGDNFPPVYTPMPPAPLLYPFLPDFLTGLLVVLGMDLHSALVCTAVPLCLALTGIFYFFAVRLLKWTELPPVNATHVSWIAFTATLLFLLNGGCGFIYLFKDWRATGTSLWHSLGHLDVNYTHIAEKGLVWPNIITDMLLPQRTSIFGLCLGFIVLTCFAIAWRNTNDEVPSASKWRDWSVLLSAGILAGLLPLFHIHSYAAVGLISGFLFLLRPRQVWLVFWAPAVVLALPRFFELGGQFAVTGFVRFQPGWRGQGEQSWLLFWLRNIGLPALLIIPAWLLAPRSLRRFYLSFVVLLVLALLFVFSPNDYDNLKLMVYWYAGTCVVIAGWLARLAVTRAGLACSAGLVIVSILSGALAIVYEWRASKLIFDRDQIVAAEFIKHQTAPHSLFLTAPSLHQPVLSLAGRSVLRGPTAWLWSHGYPFAEREADVRAIYAGRDDANELLRSHRVDYVYLGQSELAELRANSAFFDAGFPAVYRAGDIAIYDTRKLQTADRGSSSAYPPREYASRVDRDPAQVLAEFPSVAYQLYRLHKVAFGDSPRYSDFAIDLRALGRELYPGAPGWKETVTENTRRLCEGWVTRVTFKDRFDGLTDVQYVLALAANAELNLSDRERSDLATDLAAGRETRASLLVRISAHPHLSARDYNRAYLLCHYFAYLRRNPDDPPDHDLSGYNFWLAQLDRTRDYRGVTRAFIEADEYKRQVR
jgi:hypothetical protein